jgi:hypothetical protein
MLGNGRGMVAWDAGDTIWVREWDRAGRLAPARAVLTGVRTVWEGDSDHPGWVMSSDDAGTVAIAAPTPAEGVHAAIRDPGGSFGRQHEVVPPSDGARLALGISPPQADGGMRLWWSRDVLAEAPYPGEEQALRIGRRDRFGPPQPPVPPERRIVQAPFLAELHRGTLGRLQPGTRTVATSADVAPRIRLSRRVWSLCAGLGCSRPPRLLRWGTRTQAVALLVRRERVRLLYIAYRRGDGVFDRPVLVRRGGGGIPVELRRPGRVGFVTRRSDTGLLFLTPVGERSSGAD